MENALRFLLGSRDALNAETVASMTREDAPSVFTAIAVDPVSLAVFDELLASEESAA